MPKKITILFPCVGRRVVLVRLFRQSCTRLGIKPVIVGTDTSEYTPALQCCDRKYTVKPVNHRDYASEVMEIVERHGVDMLIPTIDPDLPIWANRRAKLADMDCRVLISTPKVVRICQDKRLMGRFLQSHGFDTPDAVEATRALARKRHHFPYYLKPWNGNASKGNAVVHNREELKFYARRIPNCLVQNFVDGQEHTVDVFVDFEGKVRCVVPRRRLETRAGEVSKGMTVKRREMIEQPKRLIEALGAGPGVVTIQCFLTPERQIKFIEINPRFGGGVPLSIKAGADFPRWILQLWLGQQPRIRLDGWRDGLTMLRYDAAVWY